MAGKGKAAVKELGENLIRMAQKGDLAGIKDILDNEEDTEFLVAAINFREQKSGAFALMAAAMGNHSEIVIYLLDKGANVNLMDRAGETVLMKLADRGMLDMITFLVNHGAEVSKLSGAENFTALMKACKKGHGAVVQYLLDQSAEVDTVDKSGWTALIYAAHAGYTDIVRALLDKHANINYVDEESGWTALMYASRYGHTETVDVLLQAGAQLEIVDRKRNTALLLACNNRHWTTAELLINRGVDINAQSDLGDSALMLACLRGSMSTVEAVLTKGADLTLTNKKGQTAMDFAKQLDIKRALTSWQRETRSSTAETTSDNRMPDIVETVSVSTITSTTTPIKRKTPLDLASKALLLEYVSQTDLHVAQGWIHLATELSVTWSAMNAAIKYHQTEFVTSLSATSLASPSREAEHQQAIKYHALLLRLWQEIVTLLKFYATHMTQILAMLAADDTVTPSSHDIWAVHFLLTHLSQHRHNHQSETHDVTRCELPLSQCLALNLLTTQLGDATGRIAATWQPRWNETEALLQPLSAAQTLSPLFRSAALRHACQNRWRSAQDTCVSFLETVVPSVQAIRGALYQRYDPDTFSPSDYTGITNGELEKITATDANKVVYVTAYMDLEGLVQRLLLNNVNQQDNSLTVKRLSDALQQETAHMKENDMSQNVEDCWDVYLEQAVVWVTGVEKKSMKHPESTSSSINNTTNNTTDSTRLKVVSEDHTQNPLLFRQTLAETIDEYNSSIKNTADQRPVSVNNTAKPPPMSTTHHPSPSPHPATTSVPPKTASKCCCTIS